jgi:hypothetical protein
MNSPARRTEVSSLRDSPRPLIQHKDVSARSIFPRALIFGEIKQQENPCFTPGLWAGPLILDKLNLFQVVNPSPRQGIDYVPTKSLLIIQDRKVHGIQHNEEKIGILEYWNNDDLVKSRISPPLAGGDEGEGDK